MQFFPSAFANHLGFFPVEVNVLLLVPTTPPIELPASGSLHVHGGVDSNVHVGQQYRYNRKLSQLSHKWHHQSFFAAGPPRLGSPS